MGIPAFYRWLVERYPRMVADVVEAAPPPADPSFPNPNGVEFDNLYLDMNAIIHPCFHPEGLPPPSSYEEVFVAVFKYIDKIFSIVRPRKLLFMAIDGVTPRAKMNQQRARRFRAAKDAADEALTKERDGTGSGLHEGVEQPKPLDSNVITPGTEFMDLLSSALRYYVHLRMNENLGWQGTKVILSDASVPGEGEHKIMSYIRLQRNLPGFDPNTRHCLYGLDADLIMLALATHEIHFTILREDTSKAGFRGNTLKNGKHCNSRRRKRKFGDSGMDAANRIEDHILRSKFQFLNIWVLREYLAYDMRIPDSTLKQDLERLVDDFVFICMFVGNDFLPNIPSLEISEGAIDLLMMVYKKEFAQMGGYLTSSFEINLGRVEHFVQVLGSYESTIFRKRNQMQKERERQFRCLSKRKCSSGTASLSQDALNIRLGEEGWNGRFYAEKFEAKTEEECERVRRHAVLKYVEGICWVMRYYYEGVGSWQWFYPYHYAPFASDFWAFCKSEIHFTLGEPFKPFDQLMGVLPAASAHALPLFYRKLMTDASSTILDFYPADFEVDMNGKRFSWQAICKLPFIEESRLLAETAKVEHTLTVEERQRNSLGLDRLFVHASHPLVVKIIPFRNNDNLKLPGVEVKEKIDPTMSGGMNGYICVADIPVWPVEIPSPLDSMSGVPNNEVLSVFYNYPPFHPHIPRLPGGVILPQKTVRKQDVLQPQRLWHETTVCGHVSYRRPVHKSVSGTTLAKLAHQLVSKYISSKQQDGLGRLESGSHVFAGGLEEMRRNRKRKWNNDDGAANDGDHAGVVGENHDESLEAKPKKRKKKSKKSKQNITGGFLNNSVEKSDICSSVEKLYGEGFVIKEQQEAKREESEGAVISDGFPNINVEKSDMRGSAEKPDRFVVKEHRQADNGLHIGDDDHASVLGDDNSEILEGKHKKRKKRSKKSKQTTTDGFPINSVEKLDICSGVEKPDGEAFVAKKQQVADREESKGAVISDGFPINSVEKLDICWGVEKPDGEAFVVKEQQVADKEKSKCAVISEGFPNNKVEKSDTCRSVEASEGLVVKEQQEADREHRKSAVTSDGFPNINVEKSDTCSSVEKPESYIVKELSKGDGDCTGVDGENNSKTLGAKPKKRKKKSKKSKQSTTDGFLICSVEKVDICSSVKKPGSFIVKVGQEADGVESRGAVVSDGFPGKNVEKLDTCGSFERPEGFVTKEKQEAVSEQSKVVVLSAEFRNNNVEKPDTCVSVGKPEISVDNEQLEADRGRMKGDNECTDVDGENNIKTLEGQPRKRKKRSNKSKQSSTDGFLINSVEKLDICNSVQKSESFAVKEEQKADGEQSCDGDCIGVDGENNNITVEAKLKGRKTRSNKRKQSVSDDFVNNNFNKLDISSGIKKSFDAKEQQGTDDFDANVDRMMGRETESKSRKREQRSKKKTHRRSNGALVNNSGSDDLGEQKAGCSDHINTVASEENNYVPNDNLETLESFDLIAHREDSDAHIGGTGLSIVPESGTKSKQRRKKRKRIMLDVVTDASRGESNFDLLETGNMRKQLLLA